MCFSKEVQLTTSLLIFGCVLIYYFYWSKKLKNHHRKWLLPFLNNLLLGFAFVGGHQFFEFLSIQTGNSFIYKTGLLISLSSMFFFIKALEKLTNTNVHGTIALIFVALIALFIYLTPVSFGIKSFYLQHESAFFWAFAWMVLFSYWHLCAIYIIRKYREPESAKASIVWMLLAGLDLSFILSTIYTIIGYFKFGVNVCYDAPSIWCTFFVIQVLIVPLFLRKHLQIHKPKKSHEIRTKDWVIILLASIAIIALAASLLPFFDCLSLKFVFP